ncbi:hypothetical protein Kpol_1045p54 [Vanderwaltozyma polyspora DSM 70294]|uniref:Rad21/Rec8-like protein N-terminal domain-containing protein n=1 Tax=Vanderwaltozyma polyspora (strain ATCC 22028 / DSM 70294 / BCRC 21397 / CBS 2163 / NBRC 10782 / NRRL Y-8283 / UCD 57-17) TaxID=436907 RepID=A7TI60_VANPO|nr:uncharacterized protein Kpol_1045p54 [Vanderwaltozyma polyspora DSM 70294]EDO18067.1 hypothetical protein Kpol_1045p54 [Vanderwaltozyma polyspora DSM 70294]
MSKTNPYTVVSLATSSGPLAQVWLAANMSNLPRGTVLQTSISKSANEIAKVSGCTEDDMEGSEENGSNNTVEHIALRTSGELLHGIVRVYSKQAAFLLSDIKDTLIKISSLFKSNQRISVTLSKENTIAKVDQLILEDAVTEREVLITPGLEFLQETTIPEGLMNNQDNSMQRKVTGAMATSVNGLNTGNAPWDTSIEVGRRFNPDDDIENHHSSTLNLDFDIDDHNSKTWDEGTRTTNSQLTQNSKILNGNLDNFGQLIQEDDFPIDDNENMDWDLGIREDGNEVPEEDRSLEVGRRADVTVIEEPTDFGFDLDIGKDINEEENETRLELNANLSQNEKQEPKIAKLPKNKELANAKKILEDKEIELSDDVVKHNKPETYEQEDVYNQEFEGETRLTQKRLLEEIAQNMSFLPQSIFENFVHSQRFKRQKLPDIDIEEPQLNISFDGDDFVAGSGIDSSMMALNDEDEHESDHFMPIDADLGQDPVDELIVESDNMPPTQNEKVTLSSGEVVSKTTAAMAELLRTQFIDDDTLTFTNVLKAKVEIEDDVSNKTEITKSEASKSFFEMLSLATANCIDLDQNETFGEISINTRPALYEKFITV